MFLKSFIVFAFVFCGAVLTQGELALPAKKRLFSNQNDIFARTPIYPWSLMDLEQKYATENREEMAAKRKKLLEENKPILKKEEIEAPPLQPFVY